MSAASVQRQVALAGIALLAAIVALVLTAHDKGQAITGIPQPVPVAGGGWYSALAGAERPATAAARAAATCSSPAQSA